MSAAPGASTPPRRVRFNTRVRNPCSSKVPGGRRASASTLSRSGTNRRIDVISSALCSKAARQNAATSRSRSTRHARSASSSITAVKETMAPPANGSTSSSVRRSRSQCRICGTSHVLPPGYRNGLRWGTAATLTAGIVDRQNAAARASAGAAGPPLTACDDTSIPAAATATPPDRPVVRRAAASVVGAASAERLRAAGLQGRGPLSHRGGRVRGGAPGRCAPVWRSRGRRPGWRP